MVFYTCSTLRTFKWPYLIISNTRNLLSAPLFRTMILIVPTARKGSGYGVLSSAAAVFHSETELTFRNVHIPTDVKINFKLIRLEWTLPNAQTHFALLHEVSHFAPKMRYELRGRMALSLTKTLNLITGLLIVLQFQLSFMKQKSVCGKSNMLRSSLASCL